MGLMSMRNVTSLGIGILLAASTVVAAGQIAAADTSPPGGTPANVCGFPGTGPNDRAGGSVVEFQPNEGQNPR